MANISKDISGKIEKPIVDALATLSGIALRLEIPFFLLGATARDIFFSAIFDLPAQRATLDVDIGIKARSWEDAQKLADGLIATGEWRQAGRLHFRFVHTNGVILDVIPFGGVENPEGNIQWPDDDVVMTTMGFVEAFEYSMEVRLRTDPILDVKVCTPPAMVVLKLISWDEKYPKRAKDASDIKYVLTNYLETGNQQRLYEDHADLLEESDFDFVEASARILGRDVARIVTPGTRAAVLSILDRETNENSDFRLVADMARGDSRENSFEESSRLLEKLKQGVIEGSKNYR